MDNIKLIYTVDSDLDDELLYAEFETKDAAIAYAMRNLDKLPFVNEVEIEIDSYSGIEDALSYNTIWDHTMVEGTTEEPDDDYWDDLATMYDDTDKHDLGDTTWFESMDNLVETLEDNEDTVECKECFDLFPKADCIKLAVGYVCPTCAECGTVSEDEIFKIDFPEYEKMTSGNEMIPEEPISEVPATETPEEVIDHDSFSTPEEAIPFLVVDEEEAIAGYEKAAEVIEASDLENKEEVLDTIDHIKEEEEEHIEELSDLVEPTEEEVSEEDPEVENDPISEDEVEEIEDPEAEPITEGVENSTRYWMLYFDGNDVGVTEADTEDDAMRYFEDHYSDTYLFDSTDHDWGVDEITEEEYETYDNGSIGGYSNYDTTFDRDFDKAVDAMREHVNQENPAIESDQELEGTDNAVVDCKVADVVTHSEDEKPVDCEGKKKPLEKPLTESKHDPFHDAIFEAIDYLVEFSDIFPVPENIGAANWEELKDDIRYGLSSDFEIAEIIMEYFNKDLAISKKHPEIFEDDPQSELTLETYEKLKRAYDRAVEEYKAANPEDFEEQLELKHGYPHIQSVARLVHDAVDNYTKENRVATRENGTSFYVLASKTSSDPEKMKKLILDTLEENGYFPDVVQSVTKDSVYGYIIDQITTNPKLTMSYQKKESLEEDVETTDEPLTTDPAEDPSEDVQMANTASTSGMDFEAACAKFGIKLDN